MYDSRIIIETKVVPILYYLFCYLYVLCVAVDGQTCTKIPVATAKITNE